MTSTTFGQGPRSGRLPEGHKDREAPRPELDDGQGEQLAVDATEQLARDADVADVAHAGLDCDRCGAPLTFPPHRVDLNAGARRGTHWDLCDACGIFLEDWLHGRTPDWLPYSPPVPRPRRHKQ